MNRDTAKPVETGAKAVFFAPVVSIVLACRNEASFISGCLDSIIASDYDKNRLEVIVVDGMSDDNTKSIVERYRKKYKWIRLLNNPDRVTPIAFNIGIRNASGDFIMIMSAHARYAPDAIRKCIEYSHKYGADNVGGVCVTVPRQQGIVASAITLALSHKFGVGNALFRTARFAQPQWADTAAFGCYRREVFQHIGLYNEKLIHSQDLELNLRLRNKGGRTLIAPDVTITYYARADLRSFIRHNYRNGMWVILPFAYSEFVPVRVRHLIPLCFVLSLMLTSLLAFFSSFFAFALVTIVLTYLCSAFFASFQIARREKRPAYLLLLPIIFGLLHSSYGIGSVVGVVELLLSKHNKGLACIFRSFQN